jgi:lipoprotein NlpI
MVWAAGTKAMLAGRIKYTDNAGGVGIGCLLWFASIRLNRSDMRELAEKLLVKKIKARRSEFWPGPLGRYILGQIAEDELRAKMTEAPILRDREACEAEFYIGTTALAAGDKARYFREMNLAVEFGKGTMIDAEYYLARHECSI